MQEIVPPKLNRETGILSIILNRRNFLILVAILLSFTIWSTEILNTPDQKILAELVLGGLLIPFMFDAYGRPLHIYLIDGIKHVFSKKKQNA